MIRINLLPGKKPKREEAGQKQLIFMAAGLLAGVGAIVFFHIQAANELDELNRANSLLAADIERLKSELGDYDKIKAQREELMKQRKTIQNLESGRTGPMFLLREISEILSPGKGPTFDAVTYQEALLRDPNVGFNPGWDTRRVWIDTFDEEAGRRVRVRGAAKSNEDVAEFLKRLNLSVFFADVNPESTNQASSGTVKYVNFNMSATVIY